MSKRTGRLTKSTCVYPFYAYFTNICEFRYDTRWYAQPIRIQKLLLLVLLRTSKEYIQSVGGIYVLSMAGFTSVRNLLLVNTIQCEQKKRIKNRQSILVSNIKNYVDVVQYAMISIVKFELCVKRNLNFR